LRVERRGKREGSKYCSIGGGRRNKHEVKKSLYWSLNKVGKMDVRIAGTKGEKKNLLTLLVLMSPHLLAGIITRKNNL
jgi:hypothetical protein